MKKFTFKGVLDGFRQSVQPQAIRQELQEIQETLKPEQFTVKRVGMQKKKKIIMLCVIKCATGRSTKIKFATLAYIRIYLYMHIQIKRKQRPK